MVRRADDHGIDIFPGLVEHLTEIFVFRRVRPLIETLGAALPVHIGQGDDVLNTGMRVQQIAEWLPTRANGGQVKLFIGRLIAKRF
jgi:hypothetical protein